MVTREMVQPSLNKLIHVVTVFGQEFDCRFLLGPKSYEGWYIPSEKRIVSQKELKVQSYKDDRNHWTFYIPRKELDFIFSRRKAMDYTDYVNEKMRYDLELLS